MADVRADRDSNSLLDLEGEIFFTEYIDGDEQKIACKMRSVKSCPWVSFGPHTGLFRGKNVVCSESY